MKNLKTFIFFTLLASFTAFSQSTPDGKVKISGRVIEQETNLPLEFATVTVFDTANAVVNGGLTDANGEYTFDVVPGTYSIQFDFISFKQVKISSREINSDTNLG